MALTLLLAAACSSDGGTPDGEVSRERVLAPIESVEVIVAESFPPQYFAQITSGLPSGCAEFEEITIERDGETVRITVWNTISVADEPVACTAIYGYVDNNVVLGIDFTSKETYIVEVNDVMETFVAQ